MPAFMYNFPSPDDGISHENDPVLSHLTLKSGFSLFETGSVWKNNFNSTPAYPFPVPEILIVPARARGMQFSRKK